jgi:phosphoglycerate kinase
MTFLKMDDLDLANKRVIIREDLNVPIKDGEITSDVRVRAALPTIKKAVGAGAKVILLSHLGRPTEGVYDEQFSLAPVAEKLSELLGQQVTLLKSWLEGVEVKSGQVVLCENVRFNVGEKANNEMLAEKMASLCDVFVMDAFATAHRKEASTYGVAIHAPVACAGLLLSQELEALAKVMKNPARPLVAIVGGAKVSTKLTLLSSIAKIVDCLIVGGGIANTFLAAAGHSVGGSLYELDLIDEAAELIDAAKKGGAKIPLPTDVIVAEQFSAEAEAHESPVSHIGEDEKILDIGSKTQKEFAKIIKRAKTVLWNGPVGAFEIKQFAKGTETIAKAIAESSAYSIAGGGDTIAAIEKYNIKDKISYISTGGGAFLTYLEGKKLPAIVALEESYKKYSEKK